MDSCSDSPISIAADLETLTRQLEEIKWKPPSPEPEDQGTSWLSEQLDNMS
jgi:hypothetical protein